ncbi:hypothetical protein XENORESO_010504 [Xenotaenia resolanae]|uniref:Uncharacterized protein n=1 Tax=Xenotaenia resolanae TaxID=208358 RepID=A0ABV0WS70_9TELE
MSRGEANTVTPSPLTDTRSRIKERRCYIHTHKHTHTHTSFSKAKHHTLDTPLPMTIRSFAPRLFSPFDMAYRLSKLKLSQKSFMHGPGPSPGFNCHLRTEIQVEWTA